MAEYTTEKRAVEFTSAPVMLAAWPGPGNVGALTLDYLRYSLEAEPLAQLDMSALYSPSSIPIREGRFLRPVAPEGGYYFNRNPAIIFFECDTQLAEKESLFLVHHVVTSAKQWGVSRIITLAGMPRPMDHLMASAVHFASSEDTLTHDLEAAGCIPIPRGEIMGPVGLVPSVAASFGMNAACLLATMPVYASAIVYPRAAHALLAGLERLLHFHLDLTRIERAAEEMDEMYAGMEEQIREHFPGILSPSETTDDGESMEKSPEPEQETRVTEEMEKLFRLAGQDRSKAAELKQFLDQNNIFKKYEDRFLDLFRKPEEGETNA